MQMRLDKRTFPPRAAIAGGLLSFGAVERLVVRDALGYGRRTNAEPHGPLRRVADQRGSEVLALPACFSYVTFGHIGSMNVRRQSDAAGARRHGLVREPAVTRLRQGHLVRLVRNVDDRNPAGTVGSVRRLSPGRRASFSAGVWWWTAEPAFQLMHGVSAGARR